MLFICISYNGDQGDELLIDSVKYKVTSQKRVKKVLKYSTSESFLYDILKGAITSIPRWGLMQFLEKKPREEIRGKHNVLRKAHGPVSNIQIKQPAAEVSAHWVLCEKLG